MRTNVAWEATTSALQTHQYYTQEKLGRTTSIDRVYTSTLADQNKLMSLSQHA